MIEINKFRSDLTDTKTNHCVSRKNVILTSDRFEIQFKIVEMNWLHVCQFEHFTRAVFAAVASDLDADITKRTAILL